MTLLPSLCAQTAIGCCHPHSQLMTFPLYVIKKTEVIGTEFWWAHMLHLQTHVHLCPKILPSLLFQRMSHLCSLFRPIPQLSLGPTPSQLFKDRLPILLDHFHQDTNTFPPFLSTLKQTNNLLSILYINYHSPYLLWTGKLPESVFIFLILISLWCGLNCVSPTSSIPFICWCPNLKCDPMWR